MIYDDYYGDAPILKIKKDHEDKVAKWLEENPEVGVVYDEVLGRKYYIVIDGEIKAWPEFHVVPEEYKYDK